MNYFKLPLTAIVTEHALSQQEIPQSVSGDTRAECRWVDDIADALRHLPIVDEPMRMADNRLW